MEKPLRIGISKGASFRRSPFFCPSHPISGIRMVLRILLRFYTFSKPESFWQHISSADLTRPSAIRQVSTGDPAKRSRIKPSTVNTLHCLLGSLIKKLYLHTSYVMRTPFADILRLIHKHIERLSLSGSESYASLHFKWPKLSGPFGRLKQFATLIESNLLTRGHTFAWRWIGGDHRQVSR